LAFSTGNNQITTTGFTYDASGNLTKDLTSSYTWNAESEITAAAGVNYTYDGDGDRVQKSNGKIYWYGAGTEILDESDANGNITAEYVFFGGKRVALRTVASGAITYYAEDFLGTSRVMLTSSGAVCYDADFYPFGGERAYTNSCSQNYKFEGKERDTETNNDDFGARYYSPVYGRWLSPDWSSTPAPVPYANLTNPQTLNLYAMVSDNPETFADLDGHCDWCDTAVDFATGAIRGAASSISFGAVGAPSSSDSAASRLGQAAGSVAVGVVGEITSDLGKGAAAVGIVAEAPSAGTSTLLVGAGVGAVALGTTAEAGAAANLGRIAGTPMASSAMTPKEGESGGPGAGKDIGDKTKAQALDENKAANGGQAKCVFCGEPVGEGTKNKTNFDHAQAKAKGGTIGLNNTNVTCEYSNKSKGTGKAPKNPKKPDGN